MLSQQSTSLGLQAYSWIAEFLKVESEADPSAFRPIFWMQETDTLSTLKNGFQTFLLTITIATHSGLFDCWGSHGALGSKHRELATASDLYAGLNAEKEFPSKDQ